MVLLMIPLMMWSKHGTDITNLDYFNAVKRPLISGALGGLVGWLFKVSFAAKLAPVWILVCGLPLSLIVYAVMLLFVMGQITVYKELIGHLMNRDSQTATS